MVNDLESLSEDYEWARNDFIKAFANKIDSLARRMHENNLTSEVFVCEIDSDETYADYYITARGLCDRRGELESIRAAADFIDYFRTDSLIYYLNRAETTIDRNIARKYNQELADKLDFSYFFNMVDKYVQISELAAGDSKITENDIWDSAKKIANYSKSES